RSSRIRATGSAGFPGDRYRSQQRRRDPPQSRRRTSRRILGPDHRDQSQLAIRHQPRARTTHDRAPPRQDIFTASLLTFQGGITVPGYAASKGAIGQLTKALANEWAPHNVQVNAIAPGYVETDVTAALRNDPERAPAILSRIPAGRWGDPADFKGV